MATSRHDNTTTAQNKTENDHIYQKIWPWPDMQLITKSQCVHIAPKFYEEYSLQPY